MEESVHKRMQWVLRGFSPAEMTAGRREREARAVVLDERVEARHQALRRTEEALRLKTAQCAGLTSEVARLTAELASANDIIAEYHSLKKSLSTAICWVESLLHEAKNEAGKVR